MAAAVASEVTCRRVEWVTDGEVLLSIVIVTWNTREALEACLTSLRRHPPEASSEIIVVDNASSDGTARLVRARYPEVRVIEAERNLGFAGGNRLGAQVARGRFLLFLNSDTEATPGVFDAIPDGRVQRSARRFPTFKSVLHQYTLLKHAQVLRAAEAHEKMVSFGFDAERPVDTLMGSALMVDRRAYEAIGGWDERYPFRYEDTDLAFRLRQAGYVSLFSPCGDVIHHSGLATKRMPRRPRAAFRGMFRFFRRSRGRAATLAFKTAFIPLYAARLMATVPTQVTRVLLYVLHGERDRARLVWRNLMENLRSLVTDTWRMWWW